MSAAAGSAASAAGSPTRSRPSTPPGLVEHALQQLYGEESGDAVPKEVLVPALPEDTGAVTQWLSDRRGSNVSLRIPQRGDKKDLMATVQRNAQQALALHKTKRASDLTTRSRALEEIAEALGLDSAPLRIECFDISHLQGEDVVASMVVFEDGLARKSEYRRFQIKGLVGDDADLARRGAGRRPVHARGGQPAASGAISQEKEKTGEWIGEDGPADAPTTDDGRPKRFAYPPQLVVVDGGQPQVAAAQRALDELGIDDVAVCGLAKRLEEVWLPTTTTRWSCRAPARGCICCSGSVTRLTASPSATSAPSGPSASGPARWTPSPASARPANRR